MDKLKQFLTEQCRQPQFKAEEVAAEIQYACAVEAGVGQVFEILEEYHVDFDDKSVSSFVEIITAVQNNTRLCVSLEDVPCIDVKRTLRFEHNRPLSAND